MAYRARLDDLRPHRQRSAAFTDLAGEIVATDIGDVAGAVAAVEEAAARGLWAVGYVGYESAPAFDASLVVCPRGPGEFHSGLPLLWFGLFESRILNPPPGQGLGDYELSDWELVDSDARYKDAVQAIRQHIVAGDTYQANFTSRLRARFSGDPMAFYLALASAQSGGYGAYIDTGEFQISSASPELFFDRYPTPDGWDKLTARPMKGTAPRGRWQEEDLDRYATLQSSEKDRSENLIIVDLLRNDLGRIADFGSVAVEELMSIERYDTVWQMTSTISGRLDPEVPLLEVFRALFPCGSITGAPKVRTMEIISELETQRRGVYTGAIGFVSPAGAPGPKASFSVAIRTAVIEAASGDVEYGIGGGITFESEPSAELDEAVLKARVLSYGRSDFEVIETMRWNPVSGWFWLDEHLERLQRSADYFGIDIDLDALVERLGSAVNGDRELRVRLTVDRRGRARVTVEPLVESESRSVGVAIDMDPVDVKDPFLFHKTTRREVYESRLRRHPHADDVVLTNERGELTESSTANVAVKLDGKWFTPPIEVGCLPGVYRGVLLEDGTIGERSIHVDELAQCDGIALLNSVRLWRPAFVVAG